MAPVTESAVIERSRAPLSQAEIAKSLSELGVQHGASVIAHVSLSALGWVAGGTQTVVGALLDAIGPKGTLVMASQSGQLSDPVHWSNPPVPSSWIDPVRKALPAYDPALTPTRGMGAIVDCLLLHPATMRSPHPLYSFCARGPNAEFLVGQHPISPAFGESSPLGRLYSLNGQILLLGAGHASNTSLHLAEHLAVWPSKRYYRGGAPMLIDGERQWLEYEDLVVTTGDFEQIGAAFAETGGVTAGTVGKADAMLMHQPALVEFAAQWIGRNRL